MKSLYVLTLWCLLFTHNFMFSLMGFGTSPSQQIPTASSQEKNEQNINFETTGPEEEKLKEIREMLPKELVEYIDSVSKENQYDLFDVKMLYLAFFCANGSVAEKDRRVFCGNTDFTHSIHDEKWKRDVVFSMRNMTIKFEKNPWKNIKTVSQTVDALEEYREKYMPKNSEK